MNNKLNNMVKEFLEKNQDLNEDELNEKMKEFIMKYNLGEIEYQNTPLDDAYELLEKAESAKSPKQAIKYAKEAYELCPECLDAILFQVGLEDDYFKRWNLLNDGLNAEKERLTKEKYFDNKNIGHFYGIYETRPYINALNFKAHMLLFEGKITKAKEVCKEILRLNESDNTGARYLLMAIYAYFEDEKEMLKLHKKYDEENLEMLFPLFALYYKLDNDKLTKEYLDKINKHNSNFIKYFKGTIKEDDAPYGYFSMGGSSEVLMYFDEYSFLIEGMPVLNEYVLKNSNTKVKPKKSE